MLVKIVSIVRRLELSCQRNSLNKLQYDFMLIHNKSDMRVENTSQSIWLYVRRYSKKSIYHNKYHIRGLETSWFLAPFSMGEGLFSGYAMSDAKNEE